MKRARKWLLGIGIGLAVLVAGVFVAWLVVREPLPSGQTGPAADALAHRIEGAVAREAWERTGAVQWTFSITGMRHLWDKTRNFDRAEWGDTRVLLRIGNKTGRAYRRGVEVHGADARSLVDTAWARWANDSYWLNPFVKAFDDGVTRSVARAADGREGLLVQYASGGVTPGDAYLWIPGADGTPVAWKMWVSVIPVGGLEASWEGWQTLSTGARVATLHRLAGQRISLDDVRGASTLAELVPGEDPFAALAR